MELLNIVFENSSPVGFLLVKLKKMGKNDLASDSRYLQTTAL